MRSRRTYAGAAVCACLLAGFVSGQLSAQTPSQPRLQADGEELKFVVYFSRHGVRSPTGKASSLNLYARQPSPEWEVQPGYLTPHGYTLMKLFGTYDRTVLSSRGLLSATGCEDAAHVTFYADSDQRTRKTGKALAEGMFPDCATTVMGLREGTIDPLFSRTQEQQRAGAGVALTAVKARFSNNPDAITTAYRAPLQDFDTLLATCGKEQGSITARKSIFSVPASVSAGSGDKLVTLTGPLYTASTMTENLLLAYADGKPMAAIGGGCVDGTKLQALINLHTAATDITQRTIVTATAQGANGLDHIRRAIQQAATGKLIRGAASRLDDRALFLVGHDTNILNYAAMLQLSWLTDGRRDDTAPGGALVFELWRDRRTNALSVRVFYTVQTLDQMRELTPLSAKVQPERVPLFLPSCSGPDSACTWAEFDAALKHAADPRFIDKD